MVSFDGRRPEQGLQQNSSNSRSDRVEQICQKACLPNSGSKRSGCWYPWKDTFFTTLDSRHGYWQVDLDEESTVIAQIFVSDLFSYTCISYFWRKERNLVAYENNTRIQVYLTPPALYGNLSRTKVGKR